MKKFVFVTAFLSLCAGFAFADPTASIFVKDAKEFQAIQKELDQLKAGLGKQNPEVDALWERANHIAKMNDRCSMISINEVLDDECSHFYAVELPEFETKFMEITGELRLGFMSMGNSLAERTEQIKACAAALGGILVSKQQLLKLNGTVDLEPLTFDGAFDATYNFSLSFDAERMDQQKRMMERWLSKCGDIVLRKAGDEYAPLFLQSVNQINDSLERVNTNVKIVLNPQSLDFFLDLNKPVSGAYYLNGVQLFNVNSIPTGRKYSHLVVNVSRKTVKLPLGADGNMQTFKGRVEFTSVYQEKALVGRWTWGNAKTNKTYASVAMAKAKGEITQTAVEGAAADVSPELVEPREVAASVEETPVVADAVANNEAKTEAAADAAKAASGDEPAAKESGFKVHWVPVAISAAVAVGGGVMSAVFNSKAKSERDKKPASIEEYEKTCDNIDNAQTMRAVGLGIMGLGIVGIGVSFLF